jgi:hypothetical protein
VTGWPVEPGGQRLVAEVVSQYRSHYGGVGVNQMPVITVGSNQPRLHVAVRPGCDNFEAAVGTVPIPADAYTTDPHYRADSDMVISQPSTFTDWELWRAARSPGGGWSACWGGRLNTRVSDGVFPGDSGLSATGISYLATMVTEADAARGSIDHTLAIDVTNCHGYVPPAHRDDCRGGVGEPPEGTWLRMPAWVKAPRALTPFAHMVFLALQRHGAVVTDQAGAVMLQAESAEDWRADGHHGVDPITASWEHRPEYSVLAGIPWSALQVIRPPDG